MKRASRLLIHAGAIHHATAAPARPGAILIENNKICAAGSPQSIGPVDPAHARTLNLPDQLILPAMVNAHAHLDVTPVGPKPFLDDFPAWLRNITQNRPAPGEPTRTATANAARLARQQGLAAVGDIAASLDAVLGRLDAQLPGTSFLECFGPPGFVQRYVDRLDTQILALAEHFPKEKRTATSRLGISPHAPYSASRAMYEYALQLAAADDLPLTTHLAESPEEDQFIRHGTGMFIEHLKHYKTHLPGAYPKTNQHPVQFLADILHARPWLLAHCNYLDDPAIETLARANASVAYCPVASAYFGHPKPGACHSDGKHRYRDMLDQGINVCLGTDSIVCQPHDEPQPLSIWPQMRYLYHRDATSPKTLLEMATIRGARALALPQTFASLAPDAPAILLAISFDPANPADPLTQALQSNNRPQPLHLPAHTTHEPA